MSPGVGSGPSIVPLSKSLPRCNSVGQREPDPPLPPVSDFDDAQN